MNFRFLPWDSSFFKYKVARVDVDEMFSCEKLQEIFQREDFDVCYVFVPKTSAEIHDFLQSAGAVLYDRKVTYQKDLELENCSSVDLEIEELQKTSTEISALAAASGGNSRFYLDVGFRPFQYALYEKWINNCFDDPHGKVFGIYQDGVLAALAGATFSEQTGHLELLAVKPDFRRRGFAKKLLTAVDNFYLENKIIHAEVVTQKGNTAACITYESGGYTLKEMVEVWHFWKNKQ